MTDFVADPDELETAELIALSPVRRVTGGSNGLHPEAALPRQRGPERRPCTALCAACGTRLLQAQTATGECLELDLTRPTWLIVWDPSAPMPRAVPGRGYVVHACGEDPCTHGCERRERDE